MSSMTRQHFVAIAETLRDADYLTQDQRARLADDMASTLRRFSSNFRRDTFTNAATKE